MTYQAANLTVDRPFSAPKGRRIRERVFSVATRILEREGYAGLTMERVAAESAIAKTTLYRRWPTKSALCMELYLHAAVRELRDPDTGSVAEDLRQIAESVARLQTRTVAGAAFIGLVAEAHAKPKNRGAFLEFVKRRRKITQLVLQRAKERGEISEETDVDLVIDALGGGMTFRLLQGHAPLSARFARALVELVLSGCRKPSSIGVK
jgi:AcrR family transcriptional regulator